MPLVGESARLYFPNEETENPIIISCVRKNGDSCTQTEDPANRYFHTESGNEIAMLPDELKVSCGSSNLSISFKDSRGVYLKSPKKLKLNADGEITLKTRKRVKIKAHSQILLMKRNGAHKVLIEGDFYIKGNNVIMDGSSRETYASLE